LRAGVFHEHLRTVLGSMISIFGGMSKSKTEKFMCSGPGRHGQWQDFYAEAICGPKGKSALNYDKKTVKWGTTREIDMVFLSCMISNLSPSSFPWFRNRLCRFYLDGENLFETAFSLKAREIEAITAHRFADFCFAAVEFLGTSAARTSSAYR
jgi:hypothetical protein